MILKVRVDELDQEVPNKEGKVQAMKSELEAAKENAELAEKMIVLNAKKWEGQAGVIEAKYRKALTFIQRKKDADLDAAGCYSMQAQVELM